jgi:hypothetical protein
LYTPKVNEILEKNKSVLKKLFEKASSWTSKAAGLSQTP